MQCHASLGQLYRLEQRQPHLRHKLYAVFLRVLCLVVTINSSPCSVHLLCSQYEEAHCTGTCSNLLKDGLLLPNLVIQRMVCMQGAL